MDLNMGNNPFFISNGFKPDAIWYKVMPVAQISVFLAWIVMGGPSIFSLNLNCSGAK